jgi:hypothetical protein
MIEQKYSEIAISIQMMQYEECIKNLLHLIILINNNSLVESLKLDMNTVMNL